MLKAGKISAAFSAVNFEGKERSRNHQDLETDSSSGFKVVSFNIGRQ